MPQERWKRREEKLRKEKLGMRVSGRSIFTLQELIRRKAEDARKAKKPKTKKNSRE
ncbi:MAG: hypothetical protein WD740_08860 [Anaerolineales bacterium]